MATMCSLYARFSAVLIGVSLFALAGCGAGASQAPKAGEASSPRVSRSKVASIQPGDRVVVRIGGANREEMVTTTVDRWGFVFLSRVGSVQLAGKSMIEADDELNRTMSGGTPFSWVRLQEVDCSWRAPRCRWDWR